MEIASRFPTQSAEFRGGYPAAHPQGGALAEDAPEARALVRITRSIGQRVGHDLVWLGIASLFCVVEGAVRLGELASLSRRWCARRPAPPAAVRLTRRVSSATSR
jgi:hypothetical protein